MVHPISALPQVRSTPVPAHLSRFGCLVLPPVRLFSSAVRGGDDSERTDDEAAPTGPHADELGRTDDEAGPPTEQDSTELDADLSFDEHEAVEEDEHRTDDEHVHVGRMHRGRSSDPVKTMDEALKNVVDVAAEALEHPPRSSSSTALQGGREPPSFPQVIALPISRRPLFPGVLYPMKITDPQMMRSLLELKERGVPYVGVFLKKEQAADTKGVEEKESEKESEEEKEEDGDGGGFGDILGAVEPVRDVKQLHSTGTFAQLWRLQPGPDGLQVLLLGHRRVTIEDEYQTKPVLMVKIEHVKERKAPPHDSREKETIKAYAFEIVNTIKDIVRHNSVFKEQMQYFLQNFDVSNPGLLADYSAGLTSASAEQMQEVLETIDVKQRLDKALTLLKKEVEFSKLQQEISKQIEEKVSATQRKFYLMEQLKVIKKELGLTKDDKQELQDKYAKKISSKQVPDEITAVIDEELKKLSVLEPSSSEFNITRNYLDWLTVLPWGQYSEDVFDLGKAQQHLDEEHYGMKDVKDRVLEFLAVGKLLGKIPPGKIICLVGPPGVGKTSIGRSIANTLNRKFFRFSVGGMHDVAEIKGHRRTYVGAMPGKFVQGLKNTETANPVFLIDEIDKISHGSMHGDPASALLEALDPEQNVKFMDHYLDAPVDLSKILFLCTANVEHTIPGPLADRMEFIRLSGYVAQEKFEIARKYLEPTARKDCGLLEEHASISEDALQDLIKWYCRDAGVRSLQKHIEKIYRKVAFKIVHDLPADTAVAPTVSLEDVEHASVVDVVIDEADSNKEEEATDNSENKADEAAGYPDASDDVKEDAKEANHVKLVLKEPVVVTADNLHEYVGKQKFTSERLYDQTPVGVVLGLAWNSMGGSTLYIETMVADEVSKGQGDLATTGQLGDVMKESTSIAYSVAKAELRKRFPGLSFFSKTDIHMHIPDGAVQKDGPSAGITMVTSLLSLALQAEVKKDLSMTGEITLTGRVLPIGGVREKTVAGKRSGIKEIIFPHDNQKDWDELPDYIQSGITAHFVQHYSEVYDIAFANFDPNGDAIQERVRADEEETRKEKEDKDSKPSN